MKTKALLAAAVCVFTLSAGAQIDPNGSCRIPNDPAQLIDLVFPVVDHNHDGGISLVEAQVYYSDLTQDLFDIVDMDHSGKVTKAELLPVLPLLPVDFMSYIDPNGDGVVVYAEVSQYVTEAQFHEIDKHRDGKIDCLDFDPAVEGSPEGQPEGGPEGQPEGDPNGHCPLPLDPVVLMEFLWPVVDGNQSGGLSLAEVQAVAPGITSDLFAIADTSGDGEITREELQPFLPLVPPDFLSYIDTDHDGVISAKEAVAFTSEEVFHRLDTNKNGVIDCGDLATSPGEGEGEGEGNNEFPVCQWADFFAQAFDTMDTDDNDAVSWDEWQLYVGMFGMPIDLTPVFNAANVAEDMQVTRSELNGLLERCGVVVGEGEGEGEGEPNVDPCQYAQFFEAWFEAGDVNHDGEFSFDEMNAILAIIDALMPDMEPYFRATDLDGSGGISKAEIAEIKARCGFGEGEGEGEPEGDPNGVDACTFLVYFGHDALPAHDANNDGRLSFEELPAIAFLLPPDVTPEAAFHAADVNNDHYVDGAEFGELLAKCVPGGEGEPEGNPEGEPFPGDGNCQIVHLAIQVFPLLDNNKDGKITLDELNVYYAQFNFILPDGSDLFAQVDANHDGGVTLEELQAALRAFCDVPPPTEGEPEGGVDNGGDPTGPVALHQSVEGNGFYAPGGSVVIVDGLAVLPDAVVTAMGLSVALPAGWTIAEVLDNGGAVSQPQAGDGGTVEFAWIDTSGFPAHVAYRVNVPADAQGIQMVVASALYRLGAVDVEESVSVATAIGQGHDGGWCHDADRDHDWVISLQELLRLIQFYNTHGYHCADDTEDGYAPGPGATSCTPHGSDYLTQDWNVDLQELLRLIQIYNSRGYFVEAGTEDGYAPGMFDLNTAQ